MITAYTDKKISEYLEPGKRVMIRFGHGLGDTLMFLPGFEELKRLYPNSHIDLYVESGQEELWGTVKDKDADGYAHVFHVDFGMAEGSGQTKLQRCCERELGIAPPAEWVGTVEDKPSPLVGVHFHGTALPDSVNCPEEVAKQIWDEILDAGLIPIECHWEHLFHNPVNRPFPFTNRTVRGTAANLQNLFGLIQRLRAFVGVASGPWVAALSCMPKRTMLLERRHKRYDYVPDSNAKTSSLSVDVYSPGRIKGWLEGLDV